MNRAVLKSKEEIKLIRESATIVSKTLGMLASEITPGVTTLKLDKLAETFIRDNDAKPGFLGLYDFPNTLCVSPNSQVVHGIPNDNPLIEGDIVSIDPAKPCNLLRVSSVCPCSATWNLSLAFCDSMADLNSSLWAPVSFANLSSSSANSIALSLL